MVTDPHDLARLEALLRALAGRTPAQRRALDGVAAEVARAVDSPVALVSLVLDDAQYFAGAHGLDGWLDATRGTPLEWSFCATVVATGQRLDVPDPSTSSYAQNPLVLDGTVGSYQGVPLRTDDGQVLGSLCVISGASRTLDDAGWEQLTAAADRAVEVLQNR